MEKNFRFYLLMILLGLVLSGCQMLPVFQITPVPLETETPQLSLNRVTDIPTLPPVTPTPTPSAGSLVNYVEPGDIFIQVKEEKLPENPLQEVVLFGTVAGFTLQTDAWGYVTSAGGFTMEHHSGTEFTINCDDFCFYIDAHKNLVPFSKLVEGSEVMVFGVSAEEVTEINADLVAIHVIREDPVPQQANVSGFPANVTYTEYELENFPTLNPLSIRAAAATSTPIPTATEEAAEDPYGYSENNDTYGYDYYWYGRPTSTPNRPQRTPTVDETGTPTPTPTLTLDEHLKGRYNHSLEDRTDFRYGMYGEEYYAYLEYDQELNRDPSHPTRADLVVTSNGYDFTDYWIPYVENPMFTNWGVICSGGDWYLSFRLTVDINPDPGVTDLIYTDRTICSQQNYDRSRGYIRSFGYSIFNRQLFYFYENENGYGISLNYQDYDLGFDDIPFGYVADYAELSPFYSDDMITFFGHRGGKWYYVEINSINQLYY